MGFIIRDLCHIVNTLFLYLHSHDGIVLTVVRNRGVAVTNYACVRRVGERRLDGRERLASFARPIVLERLIVPPIRYGRLCENVSLHRAA
jgi:hypothetical protein